jgi:death-on-curing protein
MTVFLTVDDIVTIVEQCTGKPFDNAGCDVGLLAATIARPSCSYGGQDAYPTLSLKAAALFSSLAFNSTAALGGNLGIAWVTLNVFLQLNGFAVTFSDNEAFILVREAARRPVDLRETAVRISERLEPLKKS